MKEKQDPIIKRLKDFVEKRTPAKWEGSGGFKGTLTRKFQSQVYYLAEVAADKEQAETVASMYRYCGCYCHITKIQNFYYVWARWGAELLKVAVKVQEAVNELGNDI